MKITKKLTLKRVKARAWRAFSLYIRKNDKNTIDEIGRCYTCDKVIPWKELHAGHGIGGRNNQILFDERIVRPQCVGCNIFGRGQYQIFTRKLIGELGLEVYDQIIQQAHQAKKYSISDYLDLEEKYNRLQTAT